MDWMVAVFLLLLLALLLTCLGLLAYSGLFHMIHVSTGTKVIDEMTIAYKYYTGPYKGCGPAFTEACSLVPKKTAIGIYYDDPKIVPADRLRYAVGCVLSNGDGTIDEKAAEIFKENGYSLKKLPAPSACVYTSFPFTTDISIILAVWRVYPALDSYIRDSSLSWGPALELYEGSAIKFVIPQDEQDGFYVPESLTQDKQQSSSKE